MTTGPDRKAVLCKYFMHGACNKGESCPFSHELKDLPNTVCTHWLKGHCAFGDNCRYEHKHPTWAPRQEQKAKGYVAPTVPKPKVDDLTEVLPISQLRLNGAVAHLTQPPAPTAKPQQEPTLAAPRSGSSSTESALEALQAQERRSPPPVSLPADPFGAGEAAESTEHDAAIAALSLADVPSNDASVLPLPDDLDLEGDALQTKLQVEPELLAAAAAQEAEIFDQQQQQWMGGELYENGNGSYYGVDAVEGAAVGEYDYDGGVYGSAEDVLDPARAGYYGEDDAGYYDEDGIPYDDSEQYNGNGTAYTGSAYGSYNGHSSGGEFGAFGSTGTSPGMAAVPWHIPSRAAVGASHGSGSEEGAWGGSGGGGAGAVDVSRFYASPALQSLCWEYYNHGVCSQGDTCQMAHGDWCETCNHYALNPADSAAREAHVAECKARHDRLEAIRRSAHVECGICMERVTEKPAPGDRRFGLLNCEHAFCLSCIRSWRQHYSGGADVEQALRTCPICRVTTHFITPSTTWPATLEEKELVIAGYKAKLAEIDCRHFNYGEGNCPFGASCMYKHAYPDGRLEEAAPRRVAADEGEIRVVQPVRLSDFIVVQRGRVRGRRG